jgi:hypothetical protein
MATLEGGRSICIAAKLEENSQGLNVSANLSTLDVKNSMASKFGQAAKLMSPRQASSPYGSESCSGHE